MSEADDGLTITVLGCSGTFAGPGGACSGYLVRTPTTSIWLDCGPGSLANLQTHVPLTDLDAIVCSHSHPDHWLEIPVTHNALRYVIERPDPVPLFWTASTEALFESVTGHRSGPTFDGEIVHDGVKVRIGDVVVTFGRTDHPVETLAVRMEHHGRSLVYSADTGNAWDLAGLGAGADLALVEASLDEDDADRVQHLTASQAGEQAARAGVASLVLTHLVPGSDPTARVDAARRHFDGPLALARVGDTFAVGAG